MTARRARDCEERPALGSVGGAECALTLLLALVTVSPWCFRARHHSFSTPPIHTHFWVCRGLQPPWLVGQIPCDLALLWLVHWWNNVLALFICSCFGGFLLYSLSYLERSAVPVDRLVAGPAFFFALICGVGARPRCLAGWLPVERLGDTCLPSLPSR